VILYEGDVEAMLASELDIGAGKEVEGRALKTALLGDGKEKAAF